MGVTGLYLADVLVTAAVLAALGRWFAPLIRATFSRAVLRDALKFGLPRVPHALAQQVIAVGDKFVLKLFVTIENIGVYSMAVSFGLVEKLFLSAFESAWAPFYYATIREPDAPRTFHHYDLRRRSPGAADGGLSATGREAAQAMTHGFLLAPDDPRWADVSTVITWTAIGVFLQGFYLLTSIGLNITKRTGYYPLATITRRRGQHSPELPAIPRFGIVGAAWANGAGYAVQAGLGYAFAQRFYPSNTSGAACFGSAARRSRPPRRLIFRRHCLHRSASARCWRRCRNCSRAERSWSWSSSDFSPSPGFCTRMS